MSETRPEPDAHPEPDPEILDPGAAEPAPQPTKAGDGPSAAPGAPDDAADPAAEDAPPEGSLEADILKWKDLALRSAAELENYRKRVAREKSDAIRFANARLLESLLPVIDTFEMGLDAARSESADSMIFQGMAMVQKQFHDFLANEGVETFDAAGQPFDPNLHEALSHQPSPEVPEGIVISQNRKGYRLRDRLLRPATVVVSSGPADADEA